jgi:hypothetical protein
MPVVGVLLLLWIIVEIVSFAYLRAHPSVSRDLVNDAKSQFVTIARLLKVVVVGTGLVVFSFSGSVFVSSRW